MTVTNPAPPVEIGWQPLPGSQALAVSCPCNTLLYEGSRGPGKTEAQLMFFLSHVGKGYGAFWRGVIFDREYKNLDGLVLKSQQLYKKVCPGAKFLRSKAEYKWVFPDGAELLFRQFKTIEDYWGYHGQEFPFIGWNELTKFATPVGFDMMKSCNRTSFLPAEHSPPGKLLPELPLIVFATTNPFGPGHNWVMKRFITVAEAGQVVPTVTNVFNPRTGKREDITKTQVRLFGHYSENRYLPPEYVADLENITDQNLRRAWLHGDWSVISGGALDDVWNENVHVVSRFKVPKNWRATRSFDWASTAPFANLWFVVANGEEVTLPNGKTFAPYPGSLIAVYEWYGADMTRPGENKGLKMPVADIAEGIVMREMRMLKLEIIKTIPKPGPADGQIFNVERAEVKTIADTFKENGVEWYKADKSNGSRVNGLQVIRDMLHNAVTGEGPGLFFTRDCPCTIESLPLLPRDPDNEEDVDTMAEDHLYDAVRYMVLDASRKLTNKIKTKHAAY